jgi:hypothetical protein
MTFAPGADGERHQARVNLYTDMNLSEFMNGAHNISQFKRASTGAQDFYIYVLSYFSGGILGLPGVFFTLVAFIYAIFYINSLLRVKSMVSTPAKLLPNWYHIFFFFLIINISIEGINTVRTYTGLYVGFFGVISYLQSKKSKYLLFIIAPVLTHVAYFLMIIPIIMATLLGTRYMNFYILLFFISFLVDINSSVITSSLDSTETGAEKVHAYYEEDIEDTYQLSTSKKGNWYVSLGKAGLNNVAIKFLAFGLILLGLYRKMNPVSKGLFCVGILAITWANFMKFIPAVHFRTMSNASVYILASSVLFLSRPIESYRYKNALTTSITQLVLSVFTLMFSVKVIYQFAYLAYTVSIFMLAMPIIPWLDEEINMSIRELIALIF